MFEVDEDGARGVHGHMSLGGCQVDGQLICCRCLGVLHVSKGALNLNTGPHRQLSHLVPLGRM